MGLIGRWQKGLLSDVHRDSFEQHLLVCPPCLAQNDKARLAFAALTAARAKSPPEDLVRRLAAGVAVRGTET